MYNMCNNKKKKTRFCYPKLPSFSGKGENHTAVFSGKFGKSIVHVHAKIIFVTEIGLLISQKLRHLIK